MYSKYVIEPSVTAEGLPQFALYREHANMFASIKKKLAENSDRSVLEKAIEHLTAHRKVVP